MNLVLKHEMLSSFNILVIFFSSPRITRYELARLIGLSLIIKNQLKDKRTYGPIFHQHQGLPVHYESLFGELHRVHHST